MHKAAASDHQCKNTCDHSTFYLGTTCHKGHVMGRGRRCACGVYNVKIVRIALIVRIILGLLRRRLRCALHPAGRLLRYVLTVSILCGGSILLGRRLTGHLLTTGIGLTARISLSCGILLRVIRLLRRTGAALLRTGRLLSLILICIFIGSAFLCKRIVGTISIALHGDFIAP